MSRVFFANLLSLFFSSALLADQFGYIANQFTLDFVTISGDASSANGTNISQYTSDNNRYKSFTDPGNFRISKYEITNRQWNNFRNNLGVNVTGNPLSAYDQNSYYTGDNVPVNAISIYEAMQFVNWLNTSTGHQRAYKFTGTQGQANYTFVPWSVGDSGYNASNPFRNSQAYYFLPTENEWVKAAYWNGTTLQTYATKVGENLYQGNGSNGGWNFKLNGDWGPSGPSDGLWNVGSGSEELNGTFDMMGNAWELTESPYYSGDFTSDSYLAIRGGSIQYDTSLFNSAFRMANKASWDSYADDGFRIASIPEPTSFLFLTLAALGLRRRRKI